MFLPRSSVAKNVVGVAFAEVRSMGILECHQPWPNRILFGQAEAILLRGGGGQLLQGVLIIPWHPCRGTLLQLFGMPL